MASSANWYSDTQTDTKGDYSAHYESLPSRVSRLSKGRAIFLNYRDGYRATPL